MQPMRPAGTLLTVGACVLVAIMALEATARVAETASTVPGRPCSLPRPRAVTACAAETPGTISPSTISDQEAIRIAAQGIGLTDLSRLTVTATRVVLTGDQTPFVHALMEGRRCYLVVFSGVEIRVPWGVEDEKVVSAIHGLEALVDAGSAQLLRVWSSEWLNPPSMRRAVAEVELAIRSLDEERWVGIPTAPPKVTLLTALYDREYREATYMEQLDAYYVTSEKVEAWIDENAPDGPVYHSELRTRDTWQIILRSQVPFIPSSTPVGEQTEPYPIFGWRLAYDAQTAECVEASTVY